MTTTTRRPLAKALHTVTAVARVAAYMDRLGTAEQRTRDALAVLGYDAEQIAAADPSLVAACVAAVAKQAAPLLRAA